jgi:DNA invertase Pin-like site-specific DNA recombinase
MSAVICCRVSRGLLENMRSLDNQELFLRNYAAENKLKVTAVYKKIQSAFNKAPFVPDVRNTSVLFCSVDRFSRLVDEGLSAARSLVSRGNTLVFVRDQLTVNSGSVSPAFETLLAAAQRESQVISERVRFSKSICKARGLFAGGRAPFGSAVVNQRIVPDRKFDLVRVFIKKARTIGTSIDELNNVLRSISSFCEPLELLDGSNALCKPLSYENIAFILNDYLVNASNWSIRKVKQLNR